MKIQNETEDYMTNKKRIMAALLSSVLLILCGCGRASSLIDEKFAGADAQVVKALEEYAKRPREVSELPDLVPEKDSEVGKRYKEDLLILNEYSRPGDPLKEVNNIVVHYVSNPGTSADENRDFFESLAYSGETYASCNFIIDLDGTIIKLVPTNEIAYCSNERNDDTISIECCHPDESGTYTDETYESLVLLTSWLLSEYGLSSDDVIRHFDITGKICPVMFVEDEGNWYQFKGEIADQLGEYELAEEFYRLAEEKDGIPSEGYYDAVEEDRLAKEVENGEDIEETSDEETSEEPEYYEEEYDGSDEYTDEYYEEEYYEE